MKSGWFGKDRRRAPCAFPKVRPDYFEAGAAPVYFVLEPRMAFDAALAAAAGQSLNTTAPDAAHEPASAAHGDVQATLSSLSFALSNLPVDADNTPAPVAGVDKIAVTARELAPALAHAANILPAAGLPGVLEIAAGALPETGGGYNVGAWGLWKNAGSMGATSIDIRATVVSADIAARVAFGTSGDDLLLSCYDGQITIKWELFAAGTNQTISISGNPRLSIADIDGIGSLHNPAGTPELEAVAPDLHHLTRYTLDNPTTLETSFSGMTFVVQGTTAQNSEPSSLVALDWMNVASWQITYTALSPYPNARNFIHDGNGGFSFTDPRPVYMLGLDLDAADISAPGTSYRSTFVENGPAVAIAAADLHIAQNIVLGSYIDGANIVLRNADSADELLVGGMTATSGTIDGLNYTITRTGGEIDVALTGRATAAAFEQAVRHVAYRSTSENPSLYDRRIEVSVRNDTFETTSNSAVSTIEIIAVNDAPLGLADAGAATEDSTLNVSAISGLLANDTDADGDALSVTRFTVAGLPGSFAAGDTAIIHSGATLSIQADGSYRFNPGNFYNGLKAGETARETIVYELSDGNGGIAQTTLIITISGANDSPVTIDPANPGTPSNPIPAAHTDHVIADKISSDSQHISALNAAIVIVDPDGDRLVYSATGLPKGLSINAATGVISGTLDHSASVTGPYAVRITATDPSGAKTTYEFHWTVANRAPATETITVSAVSGHTIAIPVVRNDADPDGDPVHIVSASATAGTIEIGNDGQIKYTSRQNFTGKDVVTYQISDGEGGFATGHLVVDVTPDDINPNVSPLPDNQIYRAPIQKINSESDYGQTWEISGAVLSAAGGHRSLDAVARAMTARQYILNAVNGIADSNGQATQGEADITSEHAEKISYSQSALSQGRLTSDPLKGFALRTVYGSGGKELIVETLLGRDNLYLNFSGIDRSASNAVADWTVELADGRPLPDWIKRDSARSLISEIPSGVELLNLKISATFFDGSTVERYIAINLRTGEIIPIKPPRAGRFAPPVFGDMLDRHAALRGDGQRWLGALISGNS